MQLSIFLVGMLSFGTNAIFIKHKLPLHDCRTSDIDLLLVSATWRDWALQIRRFKNIVQWFFPASSNDPMRLRLHLLVHVNETHFESLIHFDDYNTTDGLTEGLNRLVENHHFNRTSDYLTHRRKCLENAEEIFNTSRRVKAKRLAIFVDYWRCPLFIIENALTLGTYYQLYLHFGKYWKYYTVRNVHYLSVTDDLTNTVRGTLCNQCLNGWLPLIKNATSSNLSCFVIKKLDRSSSRKDASSFCDSIKAKLVTFETKEEFNFLHAHLEDMAGNNTGYFVYLGLAQRRYRNVYGFHWDNNLPLTFNFPMIVTNVKSTSFVNHVIWISHERSRDGNMTSDGVTDIQDGAEKKTKLVICEQEDIYSPDETKFQIMKTRDEHFFRIQNHSMIDYIADNCTNGLASLLNFLIKQKKPECSRNSTRSYLDCDGYQDCVHIGDELECPKDYKACSNAKPKLPCYSKRGYSNRLFSGDQRCDGHPDCPGGEDEAGCDDVCLETLCDDGTCLPSQWFSNASRACKFVTSVIGVLPAHVNVIHDNCSEFCGNGPCVYPKELGQGIVFCDDLHVNEISCRNVLEHRTWTARCVYLKGRHNIKLGCSDFSHLENCDTFSCPEGLYKCPSSYCIPVYNIRDGYSDCPYGEDEHIILASENLFTCLSSSDFTQMYLLPIHVCDNKTHCPRGDDELGCYVTCPAGLECVMGSVRPAIHPEQIILTSLNTLEIHTKFLDLSGVDLSHVSPASRGNLNKLVELLASNCNLQSAENIFFNPEIDAQVKIIDLSHNNIREINSETMFYLTTNLKRLNLSHNLALHTLDIVSSVAMNIHTLDLSFTNIATFTFQSKDYIISLNLSHTRVRDFYFYNIDSTRLLTFDVRSTELKINKETSKYLSKLIVLYKFYGDSFYICCPQIRGPGIPANNCFAAWEAISSCEDLLGDQVKRLLLWILAVVSVFGNLTVIGFERKLITKSYRLFVTNLSISELIMGMYLFIIVGNDVYYRKNYALYESEWRHSSLCTAAGFLATLSCETSALFVLLVTLERFLVIRFPLGPYRIKRVKKYFLLLVSWVVGVVLAVVPLFYPDWAVYSSNGMCLGFPLIRKHELGWAYSFGVFLIFNCILFILIVMGQSALFLAMFREKPQLQSSPDSLAKRRREIMVAKNLSLVVMSNFLCWFPICVIGLMTARGHTFSQQTYGWLAVFVLPLNSAVNPVIYTLPVVHKRWEHFKNGQTGNRPSPHVTAN